MKEYGGCSRTVRILTELVRKMLGKVRDTFTCPTTLMCCLIKFPHFLITVGRKKKDSL